MVDRFISFAVQSTYKRTVVHSSAVNNRRLCFSSQARADPDTAKNNPICHFSPEATVLRSFEGQRYPAGTAVISVLAETSSHEITVGHGIS